MGFHITNFNVLASEIGRNPRQTPSPSPIG